MVGEIVTAASILVSGGTGGWLADKLLGPSFEALGDQFRAFAGRRLNAIFGRAEAQSGKSELSALPPGFALQYVQKASFSEEDDGLTDMWAGLLLEASRAFDSRHASFVEILSQLTAADAKTINELVPQDFPKYNLILRPVSLNLDTRRKISEEIKNICDDDVEAETEITRLCELDLNWPGRVTGARIFYKVGEEQKPLTGGVTRDPSTYDNLERLGLLDSFELSNSMAPYAVGVEGYLVTMLGLAFVQTCRGAQ